ncbi:hypothetical protein [Burkholderia diffusa]|uniref:hypothetical protein n=1 Tax=Burkholderia diffusa TaxID=488732 RepID=UPI000AE71C2C|nr:hypothetical protein [Burkholderia diffusa]
MLLSDDEREVFIATMLIRELGRTITLLRPEHSGKTGRQRHIVIGTFRADQGVPTELLGQLNRNERRELSVWLAAWHDSQAIARARVVLAQAPSRLDELVAALEIASETLARSEADALWQQLQAIARGLRRGGHRRPKRAPALPTPLPGQLDLIATLDEPSLRPEGATMPSPHDSLTSPVVETWRLSADTSLFLIEIRDDGSWRPAYISPKRLGGWAMEVLPDMPPAADTEAAVRTWARQYGANVSIRRTPIHRTPVRGDVSSRRTV